MAGGKATGVEVARISVKVSPDTSKFRKELKDQLRAVEKALGKDGAETEVDVDTKPAEKKVRKSSKKMSNNLSALTGQAKKTSAALNKVNMPDISRDIGKNISALDKFAGRFSVKNNAFWNPKDAADAARAIREQREETDKLAAAKRKAFFKPNRFKVKPTDINSSIEAMDKLSGRFDILTTKFNMGRVSKDIGSSIDKMNKQLGVISTPYDTDKNVDIQKLAEDFRKNAVGRVYAKTGSTDKMEQDFSDSVDRMRKKFDTLDLRWDKKVQKFKKEVAKDRRWWDTTNRAGRTAAGGAMGGLGMLSKLTPSFGSGINWSGYAVIIAGLAVVAAPLVGLVSTLVLAIPGMISAIATPMMAIGLGLDGIQNAAGKSGLFRYEDGALVGLGAVFDNVKKEVSAAFDNGLTPALKQLSNAVQPLLGSLPKVATGLSDMFQGFIDSLTSPEGIALFDETIANIGQAFSDARPGIKAFTDGMLGIATSFSQQLPAFSTWLNKTGESFANWVEDMTTVPDPPGHHGPVGKSKMELAWEGLGGTLKAIGDWVVDVAEAGMKFVQDPKKMEDFIASVEKLGDVITKLVDMGNDLASLWETIANLPDLKPAEAKAEADKRIEDTKPGSESSNDIVGRDRNWFETLLDNTLGKLYDGRILRPESTDANIKKLQGAIEELEGNIRDRLSTSSYPAGEDPVLSNYQGRLRNLREELEAMKAEADEITKSSQEVALKSFETPLSPAEGGKLSPVQQLVEDLKQVPAAANPAKDALQQVADTGVLTPDALGQVSAAAQPQEQVPVPQEPQKIPAPDTSAFDAAMQELPAATQEAMQGVSEAVSTGGQTAAENMVTVGQTMVGILQSFTGLFQTAGMQMMGGLASGITAGTAWVVEAARVAARAAYDAAKAELEINSPSKKFIEIGLSTMEGLGDGIDKGVGSVMDQARDVADKVSQAFAADLDPMEALKGYSKQDVNRLEKALGLESKQLGRKARALSYRGLKDEAERVRLLKDEVDAQKDMLDLANEFNDTGSDGGEDPFVKATSRLMNSPVDFAKATGQQFLQDIGISGDGFISKAITEGINYVFNIGSVDEALSIKDRQESKSALSIVGR